MNAKGDISCQSVGGSVKSGQNVECKNIGGSVNVDCLVVGGSVRANTVSEN